MHGAEVKNHALFSPDNLKRSGDLGLGVRIILKYALAICEQGKGKMIPLLARCGPEGG